MARHDKGGEEGEGRRGRRGRRERREKREKEAGPGFRDRLWPIGNGKQCAVQDYSVQYEPNALSPQSAF